MQHKKWKLSYWTLVQTVLMDRYRMSSGEKNGQTSMRHAGGLHKDGHGTLGEPIEPKCSCTLFSTMLQGTSCSEHFYNTWGLVMPSLYFIALHSTLYFIASVVLHFLPQYAVWSSSYQGWPVSLVILCNNWDGLLSGVYTFDDLPPAPYVTGI